MQLRVKVRSQVEPGTEGQSRGAERSKRSGGFSARLPAAQGKEFLRSHRLFSGWANEVSVFSQRAGHAGTDLNVQQKVRWG